ncbi:hypothetical protein PTTG_29448 [Puccinia triticina 1-1 BBBD Race 1]|uniref:Uncharacterized protein n=1 Tax=Puccinia triticina (isolate 1-1 / race 1 (BBBD)) TaxID=630390 RepID=A0A180G3X2_PUCT1|nr:hypothetical protein PTTG_29448 [Puccinia triticina 1-1 BBBD Race 1]
MSTPRPSNHPSIVSGHFKATADSELDVVRGNQYGLVTTGTFFQCSGVGGEKEIDFEVKLMANTAITNALEEGILYSITGGRMIALNDGSTPTITYTQESIMSIEDNQLEVIVSHNNWDPVARCHRPFLSKYIVPASKNLVKTHVLYVLGREMEIVGHLVDWDIRAKMPVILVGGVSVTSGHQNPRSGAKSGQLSLTPSGRNRKLFTFKKGDHSPPTPTPTPSGSSNSLDSTPSRKGKEKEVELPDEVDWVEENDRDKAEEEEEVSSPQKRKSPGRPRRQILNDASKQLKRL